MNHKPKSTDKDQCRNGMFGRNLTSEIYLMGRFCKTPEFRTQRDLSLPDRGNASCPPRSHSMPLTCNAVGDVLALIQLAIDVSKFLSDCRGAPAECRALCDELRSLERLLVLSKPTILALQDESLRELVAERLRMVSTHIDEGLRLVIKFSSAFDVSMPADPAQSWRTTMLHWVTKASQSVQWRLRRSADATACRMAIAHSFQPLTFAVLVYVLLRFICHHR